MPSVAKTAEGPALTAEARASASDECQLTVTHARPHTEVVHKVTTRVFVGEKMEDEREGV